MGYLEGFGVTIKKWLGPGTDSGRRVTLQYPEQTRPKPERFHGRHVLNRYDDGMEKCIGCELCAGVCPAKCIYVRGRDNDPDDPTSPGERFGFIYEINYLRCIHCDLCVEACPTEAITETKLFEFAFTNRADAIYTKAELVVGDDGRPQQLPWENWEGGFDPASDTSGWMRATAPSGDADFVGIVAWAGELGYGVRAPEGGGRVEPEVAADLVPRAAAVVVEPTVEDEPAAQVGEAEPIVEQEQGTDTADGAGFFEADGDTPAAPPVPAPPVTDPAARPLLVDADDLDDTATATEPESEPEPEQPAASEQRAGLFDAPGIADRRSASLPAHERPLDTSVEDAQVAAALEESFAGTEPEPESEPESKPEVAAAPDEADEDTLDESGAPDDGPPAPAAPTGGAGFFDLPESEEPEPKRRRKGWGRR